MAKLSEAASVTAKTGDKMQQANPGNASMEEIKRLESELEEMAQLTEEVKKEVNANLEELREELRQGLSKLSEEIKMNPNGARVSEGGSTEADPVLAQRVSELAQRLQST